MQKYRNRVVIGFAVSLLIYAIYLFIAELFGDDSTFQYLPTYPRELLFPLVGLQMLAFLFRWIEWHYYLGVVGARPHISVADSMILQVAGFTMAVSPGKAGELLKAVILKIKTGVDVSRSAPVVLAERVVDGLAVIIMIALVIIFGGDATNLQPRQQQAIMLSAAILVMGLIAVQIQPLAYFFLDIIKRLPLFQRLYAPLVDFYESSREVFHLRHVVPMTIVGVGVYACSAVTLFLILVGFGQSPTFGLFLQSAIIAGVSAAVGALSGSPNGAGVTEGSTQWIVMTAFGFSAGLALAVGLMHGFFNKWFRVFLGMIVGFIFRARLFDDELETELNELEQAKLDDM